MQKPYIYNLDELAALNKIPHQFGSPVACILADGDLLSRIVHPGAMPSFFNLMIVIKGAVHYAIKNHDIELKAHDLFVIPPYESFKIKAHSEDVQCFHHLLEKNYSDELVAKNSQLTDAANLDVLNSYPIFHLSENMFNEIHDLLLNINRTIGNNHLYKQELINLQTQGMQLYMAELMAGVDVDTHVQRHKDRILKLFFHLATRHFKRERQIQFYADQLNISPTYLSRVVKELTGNTIYSFLSHFLYNEICIQLRTTEKSISDIAFDLNFPDQSALTNFFKSRANMTPLDYRTG